MAGEMGGARGRQVLLLVVWAAVLWGAGLPAVPGVAAVRAAGAVSVWGRAIEVPGLGALNQGGNADVLSMSCGQPGTCAAGGVYRDRHRREQAFVAVQRHGRWGRAIEIPGLGALNKHGNVDLVSVSCGPAGSCAAAGNYGGGSGHSGGFVADEKNGRWSRAIEIPGLAALNADGKTRVSQVSCAPAGNCAAGGYYTDGNGHRQGFVASEKNGVWGPAIEVAGLGVLNAGGGAEVQAVSCASPGNCTAGGYYTDSGDHDQGFAADERNGTWGQAIEIPGLEALNAGGFAEILTVSCAAPGNCGAGGDYSDGDDNDQGFVADERNGTWGHAIEVPGLGYLNAHTDVPIAYVASISCASAGDCTADGSYGQPYSLAFVATEKNGAWGPAMDVPGVWALAVGRFNTVGSVSCASPGNCATGGYAENMTDNGDFSQAFVVAQRHGRWDRATKIPGLRALSRTNTDVESVSCGSAGDCPAGGNYTDRHGHQQGFVTQRRRSERR